MTYKHSTLPFGASSLVPSALFDSAQAEQVKEKLSPVEYNQLVADISNIRGWALSITLALADAVNSNELGDDTPSDYLDDLMLDAVGIDADDEKEATLENILAANIADALSTLGVDSTMIEDIKTGNTLRARQIYKGDDVTIVGIERLGGLDATRIMVSMQYY